MERRVFELVAEGRADADVASTFGLTPDEVRTHTRSVFAKLEAQRRRIAASKLVVRDDHDHPDHPMDEDELLAHLRFLHARGVPRYHLVDPDELPSLHRLLHFGPGPARA